MPICPYCDKSVDYSDINCPNCARLLPENEYDDIPYDEKKYAKHFKVKSTKPGSPKKYFILLAIVLFLILPQASDSRARAMEYPEDPNLIWDDVSSLWDDLNARYHKVAAEASFKIERTMIVEASDGSIEYSLRVVEPEDHIAVDGTFIQKVNEVTYDLPEGGTKEKSDIWTFINGTLADGEKAEIKITYNIATVTYIWDQLSSSKSGTVDQIPQSYKDMYNHDEAILRGSNPRNLIVLDDVKEIAEQVTSGMTSVYDMVKAIYKYIVDNIVYQVGNAPKSCSETLSGKVGDCDDMVILFSSMCRSIGIPAYPGYGFISNQNFEGWGGHSWANVIIPDNEGKVYFPQIDLPNRKFLWYDTYRLIEWDDDGDENHLTDYYYLFHSKGEGSGSFGQVWEKLAHRTDGEKLIKAD